MFIYTWKIMSYITVYNFTQTIEVTMTTQNTQNINIPLTDTDFKVYKGVDNTIGFVVKDENRRPIDLTDKTVTIIIHNYNSGSHLLTKDANIINAKCGKIQVILLASEISDWPLGYQRYSLIVESSNGSSQPVYLDVNSNASGFFELMGGVVPEPKDSVIIEGDNWTPVTETPGGNTIYISCAYPGDAYYCNTDGLHTVAIYSENFTGKFYVQGSLEESVTTNDTDWFDIWLHQLHPEYELNESTGIEAFNFVGSIRWIRFIYDPAPTNTGSIVKVAYRN